MIRSVSVVAVHTIIGSPNVNDYWSPGKIISIKLCNKYVVTVYSPEYKVLYFLL
jgi:hypothetical protein